MKNITKKIKKGLIVLMGFSPAPILTSCYGLPTDWDTEFINGLVTDAADNAIEGIKIVVNDGQSTKQTLTDQNGFFMVGQINEWSNEPMTLSAIDVDGEKNGGEFATTTINCSSAERKNLHIIMQPQKDEEE